MSNVSMQIAAIQLLRELYIRKVKMEQKRQIIKRLCWIKPLLLKRNEHNLEPHLLNDLLWNDDEKDLENFTRIFVDHFGELLNLVNERLTKKDTVQRDAIGSRTKLAITLRYLATGESYKSLEFMSRVSKSTISLFVPEVLRAIYESLQPEYLNASTSSASSGLSDDRRIWVGNLDPRLNEFHLLKVVQKCGEIEKFDMLFHKGGPMVGQSRGYAFVTFVKPESAVVALEKLNGHSILNRPIAVRLAKNINYDEFERPKPKIEIPALGTGKREGKVSREEAIKAIENKLKMLESQGDDIDFDQSSTGPVIPLIQKYQFNKDRDSKNSTSCAQRGRYHKTNSGPYNRHQRPKRR